MAPEEGPGGAAFNTEARVAQEGRNFALNAPAPPKEPKFVPDTSGMYPRPDSNRLWPSAAAAAWDYNGVLVYYHSSSSLGLQRSPRVLPGQAAQLSSLSVGACCGGSQGPAASTGPSLARGVLAAYPPFPATRSSPQAAALRAERGIGPAAGSCSGAA